MTEQEQIEYHGNLYRPATIKELRFWVFWRGDCQVIVKHPANINGRWYYYVGPAPKKKPTMES